MSRLVVLLCLLGASVTAAAPAPAPPPAPKLAPADQKKVKDAIARGRDLVKKGDSAGGVKAFQEALAVSPEDATALSELGLAALKAGDLKLAEDSSRKSVAFARTPALRAASLYNLGRVQEQRGEKPAALDSYRRSLEDRPNKIVRERLIALDPKEAAAVDPVAPAPLEGPFPSLDQFCKQTEQRSDCAVREDPDGKPTYACEGQKPAKTARAQAPFLAIEIFTSSCAEAGGNKATMLNFAVKLESGWWVAPAIEETLDTMRQSDSAEIEGLEVKDVIAGGAPEILVRTSSSFDYRGMSSSEVSSLRVAGVGASGKPSITPSIVTSQYDEESDEEGSSLHRDGAELKPVFLPEGQLELQGPMKKVGRGLAKQLQAELLGKHPLTFP